jgi:hypothetical protein
MTLNEARLKIAVETLSATNNVLVESLAKASVELEELRAKVAAAHDVPLHDNVVPFKPEAK